MRLLLTLTLSGSALALLLLSLRYFVLRRMPSTVYYYAWILVLLRFALPIPGLIPLAAETGTSETAVYSEPYALNRDNPVSDIPFAEPDTVPAGLPVLPSESQNAVQAPETADSARTQAPAAPARRSFDWRSPGLWLSVWALGTALSLGMTVFVYLRFTLRLRHGPLHP